jgi:hypothetical protein
MQGANSNPCYLKETNPGSGMTSGLRYFPKAHGTESGLSYDKWRRALLGVIQYAG